MKAVGTVLALALPGLGAFCWSSAQAPTPAPVGPTSVQGPMSPPAQPMPRLSFDLAKAQPGSTTTLDVPRGTHAVAIAHRSASRDYRISAVVPGAPPGAPGTPSMTWSERGLHSGQGTETSAAECRELAGALTAVLSEGDESVIPGRLEVLRRANSGAGCVKERGQAAGIENFLTASFGPLLVPVGGLVVATIERLDAAGAVDRSWTVVLRGPLREQTWKHANETEWLAAEILGDVARLIDFAKSGKMEPAALELQPSEAPGALAAFVVRRRAAGWRPSERALEIRSHVWAPEDYSPHVLAWLADAGLRGARGGELPSILGTLTDLRPTVLRREGARLSELLAKRPLDARVHEQAAFLLGASALRETTGYFEDTRPALCGMSAHLSLASALRGTEAPSAEGLVAAALLDVLAGRPAPARTRLAALGRLADPSARVWAQALGLRLENDWRQLQQLKGTSLLERLEHTRALARVASESAALEFLDDHPPGDETDWGRMLLPGSVEAGNAFAPQAVGREIAETQALLEVSGDLAAMGRAIAEELSRGTSRLGPGPRPQVASRVFWSAAAQRNLLDMVWNESYHERNNLGRPEKAAARRSEVFPLIQALPLFPVERLSWAEPAELNEACKVVQDSLLAARPEVADAGAWALAYRRCARLRMNGALTMPAAWFASGPPPGTAFNVHELLALPELEARLSVGDLQRLKALDPGSWSVLESHARRVRGRELSAADVREAYGDGADGDRRALFGLLAMKPDDKERVRLLQRLCEIDGEQCLTLGEELTGSDPAAAAKALERGIATTRDRVVVSNSTYWLVDYYLDRGREAEARKLAELSAEVYSYLGLYTQARLFERLGELEQAEMTYKAVDERYEPGAVDAFYIRQSRRKPDGPYAEPGRQALARVFPQGLKRASFETLTPLKFPKRNEVFVLDQPGRAHERVGVKRGDIVRTVDRFEVNTDDQYTCVRSFSDDPNLDLVVQRGPELYHLNGRFPRVKYGPVAARSK